MNRLASEPSLYLRQHAHNPVHWQPWGAAAWAEAQERNVPVLISIGYSSCHWCHVMEREVFENEALAHTMNQGLVCIKVDREERPDVDMIYMEAVQRMGLGGGWPLNVFCTPEGEPFYGGTYFPPANWAQVVREIGRAWQAHEGELRQTAAEFRATLQEQAERPAADLAALQEHLKTGLRGILADADWQQGGVGGAPKFPLPGLYAFLLQAERLNPKAPELALLTLRRMAQSGLYDVLGGGFFRYSTDAEWFAPHFEKMLYDNAQLVGCYALAYKATGEPLIAHVLQETLEWLRREMTSPQGAFYGSIDADSEGEEGKFYTWPAAEVQAVAGEAFAPLQAAFALAEAGNWEHGRNILAMAQGAALPDDWPGLRQALFAHREGRVRPVLDQKVLAGWNGLMTLGLAQAYRFAGMEDALALALGNARYMETKLWQGGRLLHQPDLPHEGYLDDYAAWVLALAELYQATADAQWLHLADVLAQRALAAFGDAGSALCYYTAADAEELLARKKETTDSVIPSSNALLAQGLATLGALLEHDAYRARATAMLQAQVPWLQRGLRYGFAWGSLALDHLYGRPEVAILGPEAQAWAAQINRQPGRPMVVVASAQAQAVGIWAGKQTQEGQTAAWVCTQGSCLPPVFSLQALLEVLHLS